MFHYLTYIKNIRFLF